METPSSTRRVTRSQTLAAANSANKIPVSTKKIEESEKKTVAKSRTRTGRPSALIDITNDSPIVGLAMGNLETPSSEMSKKRTYGQGKQFTTTGSGEALLRGQVKTLLQKVEEEAVLSKISMENNRPFLHLKGIVNSPMGFLAPTPANTPLMNFSVNELPAVTASPVEDKFFISQMINEMFEGEKKGNLESEKSYPTRSLLLDFYEKTEGSESSSVCSSVLTDQGCEIESKEKTNSDDDNASIWSIQVNASTKDDEDDVGLEEEEYDEDNYDEIGEDGGVVDELCEAISKMNVNEGHNKVMMAKFEGKHTRFVYNSDDELEGTEEECSVVEESAVAASPGVMHLKGLPTPKGKHLRFPEELSE